MAAHRRAIEPVTHRGHAGEDLLHGLAKGLQTSQQIKSNVAVAYRYVYTHADHNM